MLVVRSIDVKQVSRDIVALIHMKPAPDFREFPRGPTADELSIPAEAVYGRSFINADGEEFCIGMSKAVQKAIGLPFEVFEDLQEDVERLQSDIYTQRITIAQLRSRYATAQDKIRKFRAITLWSRIKFLFNRQLA